jgi:hypothetical protein
MLHHQGTGVAADAPVPPSTYRLRQRAGTGCGVHAADSGQAGSAGPQGVPARRTTMLYKKSVLYLYKAATSMLWANPTRAVTTAMLQGRRRRADRQVSAAANMGHGRGRAGWRAPPHRRPLQALLLLGPWHARDSHAAPPCPPDQVEPLGDREQLQKAGGRARTRVSGDRAPCNAPALTCTDAAIHCDQSLAGACLGDVHLLLLRAILLVLLEHHGGGRRAGSPGGVELRPRSLLNRFLPANGASVTLITTAAA